MSGSAEMDPAEGESLTAAAVGEQSEVAEQEAADELDCVEGHDADAHLKLQEFSWMSGKGQTLRARLRRICSVKTQKRTLQNVRRT
jgi:hypothetical protein